MDCHPNMSGKVWGIPEKERKLQRGILWI